MHTVAYDQSNFNMLHMIHTVYVRNERLCLRILFVLVSCISSCSRGLFLGRPLRESNDVQKRSSSIFIPSLRLGSRSKLNLFTRPHGGKCNKFCFVVVLAAVVDVAIVVNAAVVAVAIVAVSAVVVAAVSAVVVAVVASVITFLVNLLFG